MKSSPARDWRHAAPFAPLQTSPGSGHAIPAHAIPAPFWAVVDAQRARMRAHWEPAREQRQEGGRQLRQVQAGPAVRFDAQTKDRDLCQIAERCAGIMAERVAAMVAPTTSESLFLWLDLGAQELGARPLRDYLGTLGGLPLGDGLAWLLPRLQCAVWWRRQLRRAVVRLREGQANRVGEVNEVGGQVYVTHDSVARKQQRNAANAAMMDATELESGDGQVITLAQAVAASTASKAIRRGELMTRIRGCEEWATQAGMVGLFTTNTTPSRFHSVHYESGRRNHRHSGGESRPGAGNFGPVQPNSPRDAQGWLCATWAKCRAALARLGVKFFGFRVAEPHHDATPHWHMLLWCLPGAVDQLKATMRDYWLADHPEERGADARRFCCEAIRADEGGAVAYVAKYIAKNIDDAGAVAAQGHRENAYSGEGDGLPKNDGVLGEGGELQRDLFNATARRVETWASAWGIRQFQAIGQPPVTVWRELRRVSEQAAEGGTDTVRAAHAACNKTATRRANWGAYLAAQGGAMAGRAYRVRIVADDQQRDGRYGTTTTARPVGVCDAARPEELIPSDRKEWRAPGGWGARPKVSGGALGAARPAVHPWTCVNNCTQAMRPKNNAADLLALLQVNFGPMQAAQPPESEPHDRARPNPSDQRSGRPAQGRPDRSQRTPDGADLRP